MSCNSSLRATVAETLGAALEAGGLPCAEVTFRTAAAEEALRTMARDTDLLVGAGTVLRADQTDIQMALDIGIDRVKFFPAEASGGVDALKAIAAPFPMVRFIPTGGINMRNLQSYLGLESVLAVGGSCMVAPPLIASSNFGESTRLTREAVDSVKPRI